MPHTYPEAMPPIPAVTRLQTVWGTTDHLPPESEVPEHLTYSRNVNNPAPAFDFVAKVFYGGNAAADAAYDLYPRYEMSQEEGDAVISLIRAHMRSWAPKHERKMEGCVTLLDRWFVVMPKGVPRADV